ncbi:unnamed protein product, partial [Symbiodinium microadriaticum]
VVEDMEVEVVAAVQLDETDPEDERQSGNLSTPVTKSRSFQPGLLTVDPSLMRGISLSETLQHGGRLWRSKKYRSAAWSSSQPAEHFDVFLSHAWATEWHWKYLSLSLQTGWKHALLAWLATAAATELLWCFDVLPTHGFYKVQHPDFAQDIPFGGWAMFLAVPMSVLALVLAPHWPNFCHQPELCFLDVASINQDDESLKQQGIYSLGGFLRASKELRILWSAPYLSRLWCIFEVAAFRTENPSGQITLAPLYVEVVVVVLWFGSWAAMISVRILQISPAGAERFPLPFILPGLALPALLLYHAFRNSLARKLQLLRGLESFDLAKTQCGKEEDKEFIHGAIVEWYGGLEAFTTYVKGPLREELLLDHSSSKLPLEYALVVVMPISSFGLDGLVGLIKAKASTNVVLSFLFGYALGTTFIGAMLCIQLLMVLGGACSREQTSIIGRAAQSVVVLLTLGAGSVLAVRVGVMGYHGGVASSCLTCVLMMMALWLIYAGHRRAQEVHAFWRRWG